MKQFKVYYEFDAIKEYKVDSMIFEAESKEEALRLLEKESESFGVTVYYPTGEVEEI